MPVSFAHFLSVSEAHFFPPPDCMTTGTRDPMDGVLKNLEECGNEKLFPIDFLLSQEAVYLDCFGRGGNGARANIQELNIVRSCVV